MFINYFVHLLMCGGLSSSTVFGLELERDVLPKKFELEDFDECLAQQDKHFCKFVLKLRPTDASNVSETWKIIEERGKDYRYYKYDTLVYSACVKSGSEDYMKQQILQNFSHKYKHLDLEGDIEKLQCFRPTNTITTYDVILPMLLIAYVGFVLFITIVDYRRRKQQIKGVPDYIGGRKYLEEFSLIKHWEKLRNPKPSRDFENLKSMQGIRTMNTVFVVLTHSFATFFAMYLINPTYMEQIYFNSFLNGILHFVTFVVQTFYLISAWLLAVQVLDLYESNKKFTLKDVFLIIVNRYLRLIPPIAVMMSLHRLRWPGILCNGPHWNLFEADQQKCENNGWINYLFIQNHYRAGHICNVGTWYVAVDTQMYIVSLLMFYVCLKYKLPIKKCIQLCIPITTVFFWIMLKYHKFNRLYTLTPSNVVVEEVFSNDSFVYTYMATYGNATTYVVGLLFGIKYYEIRDKKMNFSRFHHVLWALCFCIPIGVTSLQLYDWPKLVYLAISVISRPLFAFGIGIGILGMSKGIGGPVKRLCEWEPLVFLANFTYCIYIFHFLLVFGGVGTIKKMILFDDFQSVSILVTDIVKSLAIGVTMAFFVEQPCHGLQKLYVPQAKKTKVAVINKNNNIYHIKDQ